MRRRGSSFGAIGSSPTLVGAVTVLIVVLAVFLAYNANNGLPFVSTYRVTAEVPNANSLVPGNEVRVGGVRVGIVETVDAVPQEDGTAVASLGLKLDEVIDPLPTDSTVIVRSRSALGLKYLEIDRGSSSDGYQEGSTIPLSKARPEPVELDELLDTFDVPTREAIRVNLTEFGNALAGRGPDINEAIGELEPLMPRLQRVSRTLASSQTGLGRFFSAAGAAAAEVAPVAEVQARLFIAMQRTFGAFAAVAPALQATIERQPATLLSVSSRLPRVRGFLRNTTGFFSDLRPGAAALADSADEIQAALVAGTPALQSSPKLNRQLAPTAASLRAFNDDPGVRGGIDSLTQLGNELTPALRFIAPAQTVCNYATLLFRNGTSLFSPGNSLGSWQRFIIFDLPKGPNNEGSPSAAAANGPDPANYLHANPYPNTAAPGQTRECEAGNEPYQIGKQSIGNVPGNQGTVTEGQPTKGQSTMGGSP